MTFTSHFSTGTDDTHTLLDRGYGPNLVPDPDFSTYGDGTVWTRFNGDFPIPGWSLDTSGSFSYMNGLASTSGGWSCTGDRNSATYAFTVVEGRPYTLSWMAKITGPDATPVDSVERWEIFIGEFDSGDSLLAINSEGIVSPGNSTFTLRGDAWVLMSGDFTPSEVGVVKCTLYVAPYPTVMNKDQGMYDPQIRISSAYRQSVT